MKQRTQHYLQAAKTYRQAHGRELGIVTIVLVIAIVLIALYIYNNPNKVVYQPAKACDMLTPREAQDMLGDRVVSVDSKKPVVEGDVATSKCSYTDSNPDKDKMIVVAVAVRSGVNDDGVKQNTSEFTASKSNNDSEEVPGVGDTAFFNRTNGQLHILRGRDWVIVSYGAGASPQSNTVADATKLARLIL